MTDKSNLPAMAIIGASLSQFPNVFKGVFLYFWPFLLMYFLKDYFLISSQSVGLSNVGWITSLISILIFLGIIAVQISVSQTYLDAYFIGSLLFFRFECLKTDLRLNCCYFLIK